MSKVSIIADHKKLISLKQRLKSGLIVSCQPVDQGPMDKVEHIVAMAQAAVDGGACGLRIEGVENIRAVAAVTTVPIVGIVKRDLSDSSVRITPFIEDVIAIAEAGAAIIAFDATDRMRPISRAVLLNQIHKCECVGMADCATYEDGMDMTALGCSFIGSTLSGYTGSEKCPETPDFDLVRRWLKEGITVIAEGRYNTPKLAAQAIEVGAIAVTVGSAITRVEHIACWFSTAIKKFSGKG